MLGIVFHGDHHDFNQVNPRTPNPKLEMTLQNRIFLIWLPFHLLYVQTVHNRIPRFQFIERMQFLNHTRKQNGKKQTEEASSEKKNESAE